jgi:hypothetical protein
LFGDGLVGFHNELMDGFRFFRIDFGLICRTDLIFALPAEAGRRRRAGWLETLQGDGHGENNSPPPEFPPSPELAMPASPVLGMR